ncbi:MAG: hypothetical protein HDT30_14385 [Clostridiales bacterium]|nr:hypothetical protein [Clostridiales bacterium]
MKKSDENTFGFLFNKKGERNWGVSKMECKKEWCNNNIQDNNFKEH